METLVSTNTNPNSHPNADSGTGGPDAAMVWSPELGAWVSESPNGRMVFDEVLATWRPAPAPFVPTPAPAPAGPAAPAFAPAVGSPWAQPPAPGSTLPPAAIAVAIVVAIVILVGAVGGALVFGSRSSDPVPVTPVVQPPIVNPAPPTTATPTTEPATTEAPTTEAPTTEAPTTRPRPTTPPTTSTPTSTPTKDTPRHPTIESSDSLIISVESTKDHFGPTDGTVTITRTDGSNVATFDHGNALHLSGASADTYLVTYTPAKGFEVVGNSDGKASPTITLTYDGTNVPVVWFSVMPASTCHPKTSAPVHAMGDNGC